MALETGMKGLERVYIKDMKDGTRIRRHEWQEYPSEDYNSAVDRKLGVTYGMQMPP